jgi:diguanylate cyclase (GGDEF)-like protein
MKNEGQKKRIGVMVGNYHSDHPRKLVRRIWELLTDEDVEARFYLGTESSSFLTDLIAKNSNFDYQYASLYSLSSFDDLDVLIVSRGTLSIYQSSISVDEVMENLPDIPIVILEDARPTRNGVYLIADNEKGEYRCTEHLIREHGLKKILFLTGPEGNCDSEERQKGYMDAMRDNHLKVEEKMIGHGDYSENVDGVVEALLDANPGAEAIVSANDEMCIAIYRVCAARGLVIGRDIAVTGFDNAEISEYMEPRLTTVEQDYNMLCVRAVDKALAILKGEKVESERVDAPFIRRESCGCSIDDPHDMDEIDPADRGEYIRARQAHMDFRQEVWIGALLMREMIMETADRKKYLKSLGMCLSYLKVDRSYIALMEKPRKVEDGKLPQLPDNMRLRLVQEGKKHKVYGDADAPRLKAGSPNDVFRDGKHGRFITFFLFYEKYQYGTLSVEIEPDRIDFFYMMSLEIGSSLRHFQMAVSQQRYKAELQALARHDNLTGLYNRLGMAGVAAGFVNTHEDRKLVAMMADLDHLKQINDTFGHSAGDFAICKAAEILRHAVGKSSPLGRTGGDEYMAIFAVESEDDIAGVEEEIKKACAEFNEVSEKPYYVEISVGCHIFRAAEYEELNSVMETADQILYEAKKKRRPSVIR